MLPGKVSAQLARLGSFRQEVQFPETPTDYERVQLLRGLRPVQISRNLHAKDAPGCARIRTRRPAPAFQGRYFLEGFDRRRRCRSVQTVPEHSKRCLTLPAGRQSNCSSLRSHSRASPTMFHKPYAASSAVTTFRANGPERVSIKSDTTPATKQKKKGRETSKNPCPG